MLMKLNYYCNLFDEINLLSNYTKIDIQDIKTMKDIYVVLLVFIEINSFQQNIYYIFYS